MRAVSSFALRKSSPLFFAQKRRRSSLLECARQSFTEKMTAAVLTQQKKHAAYDSVLLRHSLSRYSHGIRLRTGLSYQTAICHKKWTTYPVLQQHFPFWSGKPSIYYINTFEFDRGAFKAPFMAQVYPGGEQCVMLRYVLDNNEDQIKQRETAQIIQQEYQWNRQLMRTVEGFPPQTFRYIVYDQESRQKEERKICTFPVRYSGPDLVSIVDILELSPPELYWLFVCCYEKLYQSVRELHATHRLRHGDIKADNLAIRLSDSESFGVTFEAIDFGYTRPISEGSQLCQHDDLPSSAKLLKNIQDCCDNGFSEAEREDVLQHLEQLEASPSGATIGHWKHLLDERKKQRNTKQIYYQWDLQAEGSLLQFRA